MWSLLLIGIGLGLIDCLNPFTISTQVVLQPSVKKKHHVLYYIAGTYLAYLVGGLFVYWGIDKLIAAFWDKLMSSYSSVIFSLEIALGAALVVTGIVLLLKRLNKHKRLQTEEKPEEKEAKPPRSVSPVFLFFFGAANTVGDLPTAFPYLILIGKIVEAKLSILMVVILMVIYCLVYIMPLILVYVLYLISKNKLDALIAKIKPKLSPVAAWAAIIVAAGAGVYITINGCMNMLV